MPDTYRRVIARPADVSDSHWSRLEQLLAAAVERQRQYAATSPHVLRFVGGLRQQEDGSALFVEHEPASPMPIGGLFNPSAPAVHQSQLLRVSVAVFDALGTAHASATPRPEAHGGLCPGAILFTPEGTPKVTDFGFAPALCAVLGEQAYVNLAVGPPTSTPPDVQVTGAWEVLAPEAFDRDDRICAFIDPEKYGAHALNAFEPGSDIIAAGFLLHMLAEHQHPYLYADPDAHRLVEMSEFMAMGRYNGARRQDLRESADPGVRLWCDLIARTLARLPQNRPTAAAVVDALAEHVKPEDAGDLLRRQLDSAMELLEQQAWTKLGEAARRISASQAAPPDVVEQANALATQAEANILIDQAATALDTADWPAAQQPIDTVLALAALPADLSQRAAGLRERIKANLAARQTIGQAETRLSQAQTADPTEEAQRLQTLQGQLNQLAADGSLLAPVKDQLAGLTEKLTSVLEEVLPAARAAVEADRSRANEWRERLSSALDQQQWDALEQALADRPELRHWPEEVSTRADDIQRQLDQHQAEQRRSAAIQADHHAASQWIEQVRQAVEARQWDGAEQALADKPRLTFMPQEVLDEANRLAATLRAAVRKRDAEQQARQWCAKLKQAVEAGDWDAGADLLAQRPALDDWPQDLLEEAAPYQKQVEQRVEAIDLERRRAQQEARQVNAWYDRANEAANNDRWDEALSILDTPPPVERLPDDVLERADKLRERCGLKLREELGGRLEARTQTVRTLARDFVNEVIEGKFDKLLDPGSIELRIDAEEFTSDHPSADGRAVLRIRPRETGTEPAVAEIARPFDFRINTEPACIVDDDGSLRTGLIDELKALLAGLQQARAPALEATLRQGLFPNAAVEVNLAEPASRTSVTVELLGPGQAAGKIKTEVAWSPAELSWAYGNPADFTRRAWRVVSGAMEDQLGAKLDASAELQPYKSRLAVKWLSPPPSRPDDLVGPLELDAELAIPPGGPVEPQTLQTLRITCLQIGHVECDTDLSPAEAKLRRIVVEAQNSDRSAVESDLLERIKTAAVKAKLTAQPQRIEAPVDRVSFTVKPKRGEPVELIATWDAARLGFALPDRWEERLADALGGRAGRTKVPQAAGAAAGAAPKPAGRGRRRAIASLGLVAVAAAAVGAWTMWPEPGPPPVTPVQPGRGRDGDSSPTRPRTGTVQPQTANQNVAGTESTEPATGPTDQQDANQPLVEAGQETGPQLGEATDDNQNTADTARQELLARLDELDKRFTTLQERLERPSHDDLQGLIRADAVDDLADDLDTFAQDASSVDADLADSVAERLDQLDDWRRDLSVYARIRVLTGKGIAEQIRLLQAAKGVLATPHVDELLGKLEPIGNLLTLSGRKLGEGDWRAANHVLGQADRAAEEAGLGEQLRAVLDTARKQLTDQRRRELAPVLVAADEWLAGVGQPADPITQLSRTDTASQARNRLDQLDLDYPTKADQPDVVLAAVDQALLPWTVLTEVERDIVKELLGWTNVALPIPADDGSVQTTIELAFVQPALARDVPALWLSQTEITVGQYRALMGQLPDAVGDAAREMRSTDTNPVSFVPAGQVLDFCIRLMERFDNRITVRVPRASEWQYALLSGGSALAEANQQLCKYEQDGTRKLDPGLANFLSAEFTEQTFLPADHTDGYDKFAPVGSYPPNTWLLYDMLGNVSEWVEGGAGGRYQSIGGSFRASADDPNTDTTPRDQRIAYDDVGLRIVVLSAEE